MQFFLSIGGHEQTRLLAVSYVSPCREKERKNRGPFPTSGKRVKSGTKKQYQSANVAPK